MSSFTYYWIEKQGHVILKEAAKAKWEMLKKELAESIWAKMTEIFLTFWHYCEWIQMLQSLKAFISERWGKKRGMQSLHDDHYPSFPSWVDNMRHTLPRQAKQAHIYVLCVS